MTGKRHSQGFTLLETMFAMAILAIALLGAFVGFLHVSRELREAQLRQYKTVLAQARIERLKLANRSSLFPGLPNPGAVSADTLEIGSCSPTDSTVCWTIDSSTVTDPLDLGTGAVFGVSPNGAISRQAGIFSSCADSSIPDGRYCRELLIHRGVPVPNSALNTAISASLPALRSSAVTVWVRVTRKGEPRQAAAVQAQVMVQ